MHTHAQAHTHKHIQPPAGSSANLYHSQWKLVSPEGLYVIETRDFVYPGSEPIGPVCKDSLLSIPHYGYASE